MHTIRLHFALTVALVAILGTCFASAAGTSYYVSPSGAGSTCTPSNSCALTTGLNNAGFGDEVVLLNGVYTGAFSTKRAGVMIRAQNKHQAILRHPDGFDKGILIVQHDDITIRGLRINGERKNTPLLVGKEDGSISNILIEENILEDSGRAGMGIGGGQGAKNIVVRHNLIQSTGWRLYGEGIYSGTTHEDSIEGPVTVHIYGNTFRSFTLNGIDLKPNNLNTHIHHNIFEGQVPATAAYRPGSKLATRSNEGTISSKGRGNHIHDNIFRNLVDAGPGIFWASEDGGHRIVDNVIMGVDETNYAVAIAGQRFGGAATEITNNTFCNLPTYSIEKSSGIINIHHNPGIPGGAPQATCNAEISRILAEMKTLPGSSVRIPPPIGLRLK